MDTTPIAGALLTAGLGGLAVAAVTDIRERLIYNEVVIFVVVIGLSLRLVSTPHSLWLSILGAALLLAALGQLARFDIIGGGDAKLIAASVLLLPPGGALQLIANIAIAGGVLSCLYLVMRALLRRKPAKAQDSSGRHLGAMLRSELARIRAGEPMPYAVAILWGAAYSILTEAIPCSFVTSCSA